MKDKDGNWDYKLFDYAFQAAEKYHIEIMATLFPFTEFSDIGGFKFPFTNEHQQSISEYIKHTVTHFSKFKSLYGWVVLNEPGSGTAPFDKPFTADKFKDWKKNYSPVPSLTDSRPSIPFLEERFLLDYNTWYLNWIAQQINVIDPNRHIHVNNHRVFDNYAEYDFPKWRPFLSSLGGSAHASWHFGMFDRKNYQFAMAANSEIIRSGAGKLPWIMTEIQAGNNIWSGSTPMCPTAQEIEQWSWIILGTGAKGMIYWTLNPRATGIESGEWAMLDLLNKPTDRLNKIAEVSKIVQSRTDLFNNATVAESGVALLYTRESMWAERKSFTKGQEFAGRMPDAGMKSLVGFYETLSQMGIQSNIQSMDEYDFRDNNAGRIIILANQIVIPSNYKETLEHFVSTGGILLVEGLSGFFDQDMRTQTNKYAQLSSLLGGKMQEIKFVSPDFVTTVDKDLQIPSHLFQSSIAPDLQTKVLAKNSGGDAIFTMNNYGKGKVLWIPTCIGIAAHLTNNYGPLSKFIELYIVPYLPKTLLKVM
jgi:beta-galactosidase